MRAELRWRANRGAILCLNEHTAHTDHVDIWLCCGDNEVSRHTPPIGEAEKAEQWLERTMEKHALNVATQLARDLLDLLER